MALHKYDPDIYNIYVMWDIFRIKNEKKRGYGRVVKFLFAKEKTRVRFPLSARINVFNMIKFGIVDRDSVVSLYSPFFSFHLKRKIVINY